MPLIDEEGYPFSFTEWGKVLHAVEDRLGRELTKEDVPRFSALYREYTRRKNGDGPTLRLDD